MQRQKAQRSVHLPSLQTHLSQTEPDVRPCGACDDPRSADTPSHQTQRDSVLVKVCVVEIEANWRHAFGVGNAHPVNSTKQGKTGRCFRTSTSTSSGSSCNANPFPPHMLLPMLSLRRTYTVDWLLKGGVGSNMTLSWENKTKNFGGP